MQSLSLLSRPNIYTSASTKFSFLINSTYLWYMNDQVRQISVTFSHFKTVLASLVPKSHWDLGMASFHSPGFSVLLAFISLRGPGFKPQDLWVGTSFLFPSCSKGVSKAHVCPHFHLMAHSLVGHQQ